MTRETANDAAVTDDAGASGDGHARPDGAATGPPFNGGAIDKLRQSIQHAFGAAPEKGEHPGGAATDAAKGGERAGTNDPRAKDRSPAAGTAEARGQPATASRRGQEPAPGDRTATDAPNSHGGGHGGAAAGGAAGLLGAAAAPRARADDGSSAPMAIKLSAITGVSPRQTEPQRRSDAPAVTADANRTGGPPPALTEEQLADATVRPLNIGPEHEGLIRRIFTRE
jgi:hypothetical protein